MNSKNKKLNRIIRIGILSYDNPKNDLTLLFKSLEKKINCEIIVINLKRKVNKLVIQEFIKLSKPEDIRLYAIGNKCHPKGIIRTAKKGEFRANVHQGGTKRYFKPSKKLTSSALIIAKIFNRDFNFNRDQKFAKYILQYCFNKLRKSFQGV